MASANPRAKFEIGLVIAGALLIGGGSILLRLQLPEYPLPFNLRQFQYSLGFLMLGLFVLVGWRTSGPTGKVSFFLAMATLIALGMPPESALIDVATNLVFALSIVLLGVIYFEFSRGKPSIRPLIGSLWLTLLAQLLISGGYLYIVIQRTENLRFAFGILALLVIFFGYSSMLLKEWRREGPGGRGGIHEE